MRIVEVVFLCILCINKPTTIIYLFINNLTIIIMDNEKSIVNKISDDVVEDGFLSKIKLNVEGMLSEDAQTARKGKTFQVKVTGVFNANDSMQGYNFYLVGKEFAEHVLSLIDEHGVQITESIEQSNPRYLNLGNGNSITLETGRIKAFTSYNMFAGNTAVAPVVGDTTTVNVILRKAGDTYMKGDTSYKYKKTSIRITVFPLGTKEQNALEGQIADIMSKNPLLTREDAIARLELLKV